MSPLNVAGATASADAKELTCYSVRARDGRKHRLCYRQSFSEVWRKEKGTWKVSQIRYAPEHEFRLDGRITSREELREIRER
jgi:hypothetical protein